MGGPARRAASAMARVPRTALAFLPRNALGMVDLFNLPPRRTVEIGSVRRMWS